MSSWNWLHRSAPLEELENIDFLSLKLTGDIILLPHEQLTEETTEIVTKVLMKDIRPDPSKFLSPDERHRQEAESSLQETYEGLLTKPPIEFLDYIDRFWPKDSVPFLVNAALDRHDQTAQKAIELYVETEYIELFKAFLYMIKNKQSLKAFDIAEILYISWEEKFDNILIELWINIFDSLMNKWKKDLNPLACYEKAFFHANRLCRTKLPIDKKIILESQFAFKKALINYLWNIYNAFNLKVDNSPPHVQWMQLNSLDNILRVLISLWEDSAHSHFMRINTLIQSNKLFRDLNQIK